jgi:peroxiredoxin
MKKYWIVALLVATFGADVFSQGYNAHHQEIISRMQVMARGTYTEAEWNSLMGRIDEILNEAEANNDWDSVVETQVIRAKVLSARGRHNEALQLMQGTLASHRDQPIPAMKKVYVEIAALHARTGNEAGVTSIMNEFKNSPHFDKRTYDFAGGSGPGDPLRIPRPSVAVGDSVSVTAMEVQRTRARHAPGTFFPDFNVTDWQGRNVTLGSLRGNVVLIDFWTDAFVWRRDLSYRKAMYERLRPRGFEIVGMNLAPDPAAGRSFAQANGMTWPQATAPHPLKRTLGIFGDVSNFLLDRNGMIIARDLYGADLEAAAQQALQR